MYRSIPSLLLSGLLGLFSIACAQDSLSIIDQMKAKTLDYESLQCSVNVHIEVPGLKMPDKDLFVHLRPNEKPIIKGKGMIMVPKKGLANQTQELLATPLQEILLNETTDTVVYKLVSLDPKSDWITSDVYIHKQQLRIGRLEITTRDFGSFMISHKYQDAEIPKKTTITFESMPFKIPLKFLGGNRVPELENTTDGPVTGKVVLRYSDVVLE